MAGIYGMLGLADNDRSFINTIGQDVVYAAAQQYLAQHNADVQAAYSVFVEMQTPNFKERYRLPGGGRLQRRGGLAQSGAVQMSGSWDVAYPLENFGAQFAYDRVSIAYLTVQQFNNELETIRIQDVNTRRFEMLRALFNNTSRTFVDDLPGGGGTLTLVPLANNDSVLYPPIIGSETEQQLNHYLVSGYAASAISDANNPYLTLRDTLERVHGMPSGYGNIVCFIHPDQTAKTTALLDFSPVEDVNVRYGASSNLAASDLPTVPGRIIGRVSGTWVAEWRWIPTGYILAVNADMPGPLKERVHPDFTNLGTGLQMVVQDDRYPIQSMHYEDHFGYGVGNRLNGAIMELKSSGSYSVPSAYA
jgi:hypothetical protein